MTKLIERRLIRPGIKKNSYYYLNYLISMCKTYFRFLLVLELFFLFAKLYSYDVERCFIDIVRKDIENKTIFASARTTCWVFGLYKETFHISNPSLNLIVDFTFYGQTPSVFKILESERNFIRNLILLIYGLALVQLFLHRLQNQFNVFYPIVEALKNRCIFDYCQFDRQYLSLLITQATQKGRIHFYFIVLFQIVYQGLLFVLIFAVKLVLYGQYEFSNQTIDHKSIILFPVINQPKLPEIGYKIQDHQLRDILIPSILNQIFIVLWKISLVIFFFYLLLILIRLVQFSVNSIRTKIILSFLPNSNNPILEDLIKHEFSFYFLYKLACSIDHFYLNMMVDCAFYENGKFNEGNYDQRMNKKKIPENGSCEIRIDQNDNESKIQYRNELTIDQNDNESKIQYRNEINSHQNGFQDKERVQLDQNATQEQFHYNKLNPTNHNFINPIYDQPKINVPNEKPNQEYDSETIRLIKPVDAQDEKEQSEEMKV